MLFQVSQHPNSVPPIQRRKPYYNSKTGLGNLIANRQENTYSCTFCSYKTKVNYDLFLFSI